MIHGSAVMTCTDQRARRVECNVQAVPPPQPSPSATTSLPPDPRPPPPAKQPAAAARLPRQSVAARPQRCSYRKSIVVERACVCFVSRDLCLLCNVYTKHVRATWPCVVDMSLSAPAQPVRGTRTSSLDQLDFQERRQLIASSLSLTDFLHVGAKEVAAVAAKKQNGSAVRTNSLGSGARTPPAERTKSKFSAFGRLFKPWKWKRKKKSEKFEAASRTLERKISVRANREELVQKGILMPESPVTPVPEANEDVSPGYEEGRVDRECVPGGATLSERSLGMHAALQAQLAAQLAQQQLAHHHQNNNIIEPKKDKLENGGEMVRPERPNSLSAGKLPRRMCYQGDVVGGYGGGVGSVGDGDVSEEQLMLSELPEPPIALSEIGPIPPPPMFSSPSPTRHHHPHQHPHPHPHTHPHPLSNQLSDSEDEDSQEEEEGEAVAGADTSRVEEIPPKEPLYNAVPLKSALKKRPAASPAGTPLATPLAPRQDHHHASFNRPVRVGNATDNKENARPWEGDYSEYSSESERVAAKLARKESLNIKLALRPDRQELINRNILVVQSEHERQESWEAIGARLIRRLSMRPTAEELVERNILKSQSPAEEKKQKEEKKRYLLRKLSFRPTVDELKEKKIIRFSDYIEVTQAHDYDRRADKPWTRLTPRDKAAIRRELNEFKSSEMAVHEESKHLTRFHRP
ncbi:phosphatase and actin regulator 1 isoform X4 [Danaus plexippus]|uniref:phosphatase and actin regulator 1 isoform X4 n=1 Tax=Danaus plexippus TaxID=13037 RepID=UPI002AB14E83|nr:phosphatase and actin regulator 1 isoform X4 [Danaus plexippus]